MKQLHALAGKPEPEPTAAEPDKKDEEAASRAPLLRLIAERLLDPELELPAEAGALHKQVSTTYRLTATWAAGSLKVASSRA